MMLFLELRIYGGKVFRTDLNGEIDIEVNKKSKCNIKKFIN